MLNELRKMMHEQNESINADIKYKREPNRNSGDEEYNTGFPHHLKVDCSCENSRKPKWHKVKK